MHDPEYNQLFPGIAPQDDPVVHSLHTTTRVKAAPSPKLVTPELPPLAKEDAWL